MFKNQALFIRGAKSNYIRCRVSADINSIFQGWSNSNAGHWLHAEDPQFILQI
jgi:hypothetical protein